jgi:hypothetical protein
MISWGFEYYLWLMSVLISSWRSFLTISGRIYLEGRLGTLGKKWPDSALAELRRRFP